MDWKKLLIVLIVAVDVLITNSCTTYPETTLHNLPDNSNTMSSTKDNLSKEQPNLNLSTPSVHVPENHIVIQNKIEKLHGRAIVTCSTIGHIDDKDYLFVGINKEIGSIDSLPGILIFNIVNPSNPEEVVYLPAPNDIQWVGNLEIKGNLLYVSSWKYLWIINVSDPSSPGSQIKVMIVEPMNISISGNYAYIDNNGEMIGGKIAVIDIYDSINPKILSILDLSSDYNFSSFKIFDSYLYTFAQNKYNQIVSLHIIDISIPGSLKEVGIFNLDRINCIVDANPISTNDFSSSQPLPVMAFSGDYDIEFASNMHISLFLEKEY
jgi:hypothetical protein